MRLVPDALRLTLRSLAKQPGFVLGAVLTIAIGVGANLAIFGYLSVLLWPSVDAPAAKRIHSLTDGAPGFGALSYADFDDVRRSGEAFTDTVGWHLNGTPVRLDAERTVYGWLHAVSPGYFAFFGARPALGRDFVPADHAVGAPGTVVLGDRFWKRHFASDPDVLGRTIELGLAPYRIIGVAPAGFAGGSVATDLYLPLSHAENLSTTLRLHDRASRAVIAVTRFPAGLSLAAAQDRLDAFAAGLEREHASAGTERRFFFTPLASASAGDPLVAPGIALGAISLLLLLLAAANLGSLLLARASARARDLGVRLALGAGRSRIAGAVVLESLLLALAGGAAGWLLGRLLFAGVVGYLSALPFGMSGWTDGGEYRWLNLRLQAGAWLLALVMTVVSGLLPALLASRRDPARLLTGGPAAGRTRRESLGGSLLLAFQLALSLLLLIGAGLLGGSLRAARGNAVGFEPDRMLLAAFAVHGLKAEDRSPVYLEIQDELARVPGIEAATLTQVVPLWGSRSRDIELAERPGEAISMLYVTVGPDYFATLGVPLLAGRALDRRDAAGALTAVVVNRSMAERLWPGESAVGRRLRLANHPSPEAEVVGVAADYQQTAPLDPPTPLMFLAFQQEPRERMIVMARTAGPPASWIEPARRALAAAHPGTAVIEVAPFSAQVERALFDRRLYSDAAALFSVLGLALAVQGLFSLMTYSVTRRSREIGLRMALGATARGVRRAVVLEALRIAALGGALGLAAAIPLAKLLANQLYGVGTAEPAIYLGALAVLALAAVLAAYLPARQASRVDPMQTLRRE